jgi:hypothetical protein
MSDPMGAVEVTLDEMEKATQELPKVPSLADIKLEGDDVPAIVRGKSAQEAINGLVDALKVSEQARQQALLTAEAAVKTPAPVAPPPPPAPKELTIEELKALHDEDPFKAIQVMHQQAEQRVLRQYEERVRPLISGVASSAEQQARAKYADEFELFGDQISRAIDQFGARDLLSNPGTWDDIVAYVRGRGGNIEKLIERKTKPKVEERRATAQQQQAESVGFTDNSGSRGRKPSSVDQLDPIQREVAEKMGITPEDYIKHMI